MTLLPGLPTPALLVDVDVLDRNIAAMAKHAAQAGLRLRPHAKTHKCLEIARRQLDLGAGGLTVATVAEAELFAAAGFTDLFIAYPLWLDSDRARRLHDLAENVTVTIGLDSVEGARVVAAQLGEDRARIRVLVEVDSGHHRTGISPEDAGAVADQARHVGLDVRGIFTFPGHSYSPGGPMTAAEDERQALSAAATALRRVGVEPAVISGGSTPSARWAETGPLTELRPGVYVFGDAQQLELGTCTSEEIALTALGTVVSHHGDGIVLDTGSKVLGADRAPWATGFGRLLDHPDARITALSEHHATVAWDGSPRPPLGSRVRVVPNHVCNAVNLADELVVVHDGRAVDRWRVAARGANT